MGHIRAPERQETPLGCFQTEVRTIRLSWTPEVNIPVPGRQDDFDIEKTVGILPVKQDMGDIVKP
jgi:hypothetical protein